MPEIELVKSSKGDLHGYGTENQERWAKFKRFTTNLEAGECFTFTYKQPRNPKFLRKYFALLNLAFDAWEPGATRKRLTYKGRVIAKDFEAFREEVTILAGFYEMTFDLRGRMSLRAKSIAFHNMTEEEFGRLYEATVKVVLEHVLTNYKRDDLDRVVEEVQRF